MTAKRLPARARAAPSGPLPQRRQHVGESIEPNTQRPPAPTKPASAVLRLSDLKLSAQEWAAVARQGFVSCEWRGNAGPYYKLRFRLAGRQRVRYLGSDSAVADAIGHELRECQRTRRADRRLKQTLAQGRALLRRLRARLTPTCPQWA